jgi:hypothetical protein
MSVITKELTLYGEYVESCAVNSEELVKITGLTPKTVYHSCYDPVFKPTRSTMKLLVTALKQLTGKNVDKWDFWSCEQ